MLPTIPKSSPDTFGHVFPQLERNGQHGSPGKVGFRGEKIHTSEANLNYQRSLLLGEYVEWTCMAGYKLFFVSAEKFWICSTAHGQHIMDVTLNDLYANYRKKSCQEGCGVYFAVSDSLLVEKLCSGSREGKRRARQTNSVKDSWFLNS